MAQQSEGLGLTELEASILKSIDHVGWYAYLWFPIVYRRALNFGSDAPDAEVHAAFASLIRKGALVMTRDEKDNVPQWGLAPGALEAATRTLCEVRGPLYTKGYRIHANSPRPHFVKLAQKYIAGEHWHLYEVGQAAPGMRTRYFWRDVWLAGVMPPPPSGAVPVTSVDLVPGVDQK